MTGLERQYLRECLKALVKARDALMSLDCARAVLNADYGKSDTFILDAAPETALIRSLCEDFDPHLPFVTEETGEDVHLTGSEEEVVCFADPMDRSKVLQRFLSDKRGSVRHVFDDKAMRAQWESTSGGDAALTGPYGSITATRHHHVLFNVMINYLTGELYIASDAATGRITLSSAFEDVNAMKLKRTADLLRGVEPVRFDRSTRASTDKALKFVTYCQGQKYEDNLVASDVTQLSEIRDIRKERLVFDEPGGPARVLYLAASDVGFILSNGEKIGEWLGWLAWVKHSTGTLRAYEITFDSSWTRDEVLMAPGQAYTILGDEVRSVRGLRSKQVRLNLMKLRFLKNPSQYRGTILVCPTSNETIRRTLFHRHVTELDFEM